MSISKSSFIPHTNTENIESLADVLPVGRIFESKSIKDSNFYKLNDGLGKQIGRYEQSVFDLICTYIPNFDNSIIDDWEAFVGIPDESFESGIYTDSQRRRNIIIKLAYMNLQTDADYIALADILGLTVTVQSGAAISDFPVTFPIFFGGSNVIVITIDTPPLSGFPYQFPIQFDDTAVSLYQNLVERQKPATDIIVFEYV